MIAECNVGATGPFLLHYSFSNFLRRALASLSFTVMRVGAERHGRIGVTGDGLDFLDVQPGLKKRRYICVSQLVWAHRKVNTF